jgi:hypothetical protein
MILAKGFIHQQELAKEVDRIRPLLGPEVVRLTYVLEEDWSGDPAIFFRVVLADWAGERTKIGAIARQIERTVVKALRPVENWGLLHYFSYRTEQEHAQRTENDWP